MIAHSMVSPADQQVLDLFEFTVSKKPERALYPHPIRLRRKIREVIYGQRPAIKLYSTRLKTDFWLVNEGLADPLDTAFEGKAVTMQALAEFMLNAGANFDIAFCDVKGGKGHVGADHDLPLPRDNMGIPIHKMPCEP